MIKYLLTAILIVLILWFIYNNMYKYEGFENANLPTIEDVHYVHLYDNNKNKLNVVLIGKPFATLREYRLYVKNINKFLYIGISSYMEFPYVPSNPDDNYEITHEDFNNTEPYHVDMYFEMCKGWLHCFREPSKYIPMDKPHALISESDFVDYKNLTPDPKIEKEFDFLYSCPKVTKKSGCFDWVSYNKNWELALKCLPILCAKFKLKGLLIGREGCDIPEDCKPYITTTGWLDYGENIKQYNRCKFIFTPNVRDASPRVLTEAMSFNLPILVNYDILGGWKYVTEQTGEFFKSELDLEASLNKFLPNLNKYTPRQFIIDNYGPVHTGRRLKKFLFENFKNQITAKEEDIDYITLRHSYSGY
jgi:hypothetical protein